MIITQLLCTWATIHPWYLIVTILDIYNIDDASDGCNVCHDGQAKHGAEETFIGTTNWCSHNKHAPLLWESQAEAIYLYKNLVVYKLLNLRT